MQKYFNVFMEFNRIKLNTTIEKAVAENGKGYVCAIDGNVLAMANINENYRAIVNNALVNSCDGSSIAMMINNIYKKKYQVYTGPEIFNNFIRKGYLQFFVGNSVEILNQLRSSFENEKIDINSMQFLPLPFLKVEEFDYKGIAKTINTFSPSIIWISLGAPKQEIFISKLLPHINSGVIFAIGAAFNLYLDKENPVTIFLRNIHLGWLLRIIKEPKRIGPRAWNYLRLIPKLFLKEKKIQSNKTYETTSSEC